MSTSMTLEQIPTVPLRDMVIFPQRGSMSIFLHIEYLKILHSIIIYGFQ